MMKRIIIGTTLALALAGSAFAQEAGLKKIGGVLVNPSGMTVYTFDKDAPGSGKSVCNDQCAKLWPPVLAPASEVKPPYSVITRDDGSKQLAYNGKPLYLYAADKMPGDKNGDNVKGIWHVVKE